MNCHPTTEDGGILMDSGCDLLVVDDDETQVHLLRSLLTELGLFHRCHHAANAAEALDFLHQRPPYEEAPRPHLILLDLNMPGADGHEALLRMKTDHHTRSIPVIILSQSSSNSEIKACYEEGANAYVVKPCDLISSLRVVESLHHFWLGYVSQPVDEK